MKARKVFHALMSSKGYTDLVCGFAKRQATLGRVVVGFTTATSTETARFVDAL